MASDAKKNTKKDDDEQQESKSSAPAPSGGKANGMGIMLPLVIVAILLGLGGLGVGGYFLFTNMQAANASTEGDATEETAAEEITDTNIYFDEFPEGIVNMKLSDQNAFTYLKYAFSLEVDTEKTKEELKEMLPKLKGKVATVMSNRTWDEISLSKGRDALAAEVLATVNEQLPEGKCIGLYFTTFVAQ